MKWFLPEAGSEEARALLEGAERGTISLLGPDFVLIESANVLRTRHRRGETTIEDARTALDRLLVAFSELLPGVSLIDSALGLAMALPISVYDALYVALAAREECVLVTADARLASNVPASVAEVVLLGDFSA